jgi:hypothetical protein
MTRQMGIYVQFWDRDKNGYEIKPALNPKLILNELKCKLNYQTKQVVPSCFYSRIQSSEYPVIRMGIL